MKVTEETDAGQLPASKRSFSVDGESFKRKTAKLGSETCHGVTTVTEYELASGCRLALSIGSVVDFNGGAIVNAANVRCLGGGGVDGAITAAGGQTLAEARRQLPILADNDVRCRVGEAVATIGGKLAATWCIHAVGPNYNRLDEDEFDEGDRLLASAYANAMKRAKELSVETIAFSLLSAGICRGPRPLRQVLSIAVQAVAKHTYKGLAKVHLVAFTKAEVSHLLAAADEMLLNNVSTEHRACLWNENPSSPEALPTDTPPRSSTSGTSTTLSSPEPAGTSLSQTGTNGFELKKQLENSEQTS